ncbi:MAG: hypothetical protein U0228_38700 [Myxococcaceae bacterium]
MKPEKPDLADQHLADSGEVHDAIPAIFGFVFIGLLAPFVWFGATDAVLDVAGPLAAAIAAVVTILVIVKSIRESGFDVRVARHLLVTTWLPYIFGLVCAVYAHRLEPPWRCDSMLSETCAKPSELFRATLSIWSSVAAHCAWLGVAMTLSGAVLRWAQNGDLRARIVGQWVGIFVGVLFAVARADHAYLERAERQGGIRCMRHEERIDSAMECLQAKGRLIREETTCTSGPHGQDCDSQMVEVPCSVDDANRDLLAVYRARVRNAAQSDPRVLADGAALGNVFGDCLVLATKDAVLRPPLTTSLCAEFERNSGDGDRSFVIVHSTCINDCAETVGLEVVPECARKCTQAQLPWIPDAAFTYESRLLEDLDGWPDGGP